MRWVACLIVTTILLAGCAAKDPIDAATSADPQGALYDDETGAIVGVVVDDSLLPIADAAVLLDGDASAVTAEDGSFRFASLTPGEHALAVSKQGYGTSDAYADVLAGSLVEITVTLVPVATLAAYHETKIVAGLIGCGMAVRVPNPQGGSVTPTPAICGVPDIATGGTGLNDHVTDINFGDVGADWVGFWAETAWRSNQALGTRMTVNWWSVNVPQGQTGRVSHVIPNGTLAGPSPLATRFTLNETQEVIDGSLGKRELCIKTCMISAGHFSAAESSGLGVTIQQRFDDYVTLFHHGELPLEFTALPDG